MEYFGPNSITINEDKVFLGFQFSVAIQEQGIIRELDLLKIWCLEAG